MKGLNTNNAPHISVIIPHFMFGASCFILIAVLLFMSDNALLLDYFNSKLVAITHLTVLGWISIIIFGALYQLIPVVLETTLFSEKLAKVTFWMTAFSCLFLTYCFWIGNYGTLLSIASVAMFLSLLAFVLNIALTFRKAVLRSVKSKFIVSSIIWLAITEFIGTLIALNFKFNFLSEVHLHYLKMHAIVGLTGWFLMLIIGVGATLLPMFFIAHELNEKKLSYALITINLGIVVLLINWLFVDLELITIIGILSIICGVLLFLSYIRESYKKRLRKKLDVGMNYSVISLVVLMVPVVLSFVLMNGFQLEIEMYYRTVTFFGFSVLFGFITTLILGQTYKTLPFIVWLHKYKNLVGKTETPLPKELYSSKLAAIQFAFYIGFLIMFAIGFSTGIKAFLKIGSLLLLSVALVYNINIFKIIYHRVKKEENE